MIKICSSLSPRRLPCFHWESVTVPRAGSRPQHRWGVSAPRNHTSHLRGGFNLLWALNPILPQQPSKKVCASDAFVHEFSRILLFHFTRVRSCRSVTLNSFNFFLVWGRFFFFVLSSLLFLLPYILHKNYPIPLEHTTLCINLPICLCPSVLSPCCICFSSVPFSQPRPHHFFLSCSLISFFFFVHHFVLPVVFSWLCVLFFALTHIQLNKPCLLPSLSLSIINRFGLRGLMYIIFLLHLESHRPCREQD